MKKAWTKPKLVVLVRGKPEETVLRGCKQSGPDPWALYEWPGGSSCYNPWQCWSRIES